MTQSQIHNNPKAAENKQTCYFWDLVDPVQLYFLQVLFKSEKTHKYNVSEERLYLCLLYSTTLICIRLHGSLKESFGEIMDP